jgi:hypothetical protein
MNFDYLIHTIQDNADSKNYQTVSEELTPAFWKIKITENYL